GRGLGLAVLTAEPREDDRPQLRRGRIRVVGPCARTSPPEQGLPLPSQRRRGLRGDGRLLPTSTTPSAPGAPEPQGGGEHQRQKLRDPAMPGAAWSEKQVPCPQRLQR